MNTKRRGFLKGATLFSVGAIAFPATAAPHDFETNSVNTTEDENHSGDNVFFENVRRVNSRFVKAKD